MTVYIERFKELINQSDISGAHSHLKSFPEQSDSTKFEIIHELALAPDPVAFDILLPLADYSRREPHIHDRIIQLVTDRTHINFKFSIILYHCGTQNHIAQAAPLMRHILINETDRTILAESIRTAGNKGINALVDDIAEYLYYDDPILKQESVNALKTIGSSQALLRLQQVADTTKCDASILDAVRFLSAMINPDTAASPVPEQEDIAPDSCYQSLTSTDVAVRFTAFNEISGMGAEIPLAWIEDSLHSDNHDLTVNTLRIITRTLIGQCAGYLLSILDMSSQDDGITFCACEALRAFPRIESPAPIIKHLDNPSLHVRMAAIRALDKHMTDLVCAEIKNRIETGRKKGEALAELIVDAQAEKLMSFLTASDTFTFIATNYLSRQAPRAAIKSYIRMLQQRRLHSTAKRIEQLVNKPMATAPLAIVISTSTTVQSVYNRILTRCGYSPECFRSPQPAFEFIYTTKPALIISDLFLNSITGIDFSEEIRGIYPAGELPIILSTLQTDFTDLAFQEKCLQRGIDAVTLFPASVSFIRETVDA